MRPYSIEDNSLHEDQTEENDHIGFSHLPKKQRNQELNQSSNIFMQIKNCSQKGVLIVVLVLIGALFFFSHVSFDDQKSIQSGKISVSFPVDKLLKNTFQSGKASDSQNPILKVAKTHNITKTQIQNAVKYTQVIPLLSSQDDKSIKIANELSQKDKQNIQIKYDIKRHNQNSINFCIILPFLQQNLQGKSLNFVKSIIYQNYSNYKIVFAKNETQSISPILNYAKKENIASQKILSIQKSGQNVLQNIYFGIKQHCMPNQVIIVVNKVESFVGNNILSLYNAVFQQSKAFILYTQFLKINDQTSTVELGDFKSPIEFYEKVKTFKNFQFQTQFPLIAFSFDVFQSIPIDSLVNKQENFYTKMWQTALLKPIFELSAQSMAYSNEITFYVNSSIYGKKYKPSIQQIKLLEEISNHPELQSLKENPKYVTQNKQKVYTSDIIKEGKNQIVLQKSDEKQTSQIANIQLKKEDIISKESLQKTKEVSQIHQSDILQKQNDENELKEPVLPEAPENEREPLQSPTIVKLQTEDEKQHGQNQKVEIQQGNQNQHRPDPTSQKKVTKQTQKSDIVEQVFIDGKKSIKSKEVLPVDEIGGFFEIEDQQVQQVKTPNPEKKAIKRIFPVTAKTDVKGPNYTFSTSIEDMINGADLQKIFGKRKSKEGIWKTQFFEAIQKLQITNNVKYGGQIEVELTKFDNDKFQKIKRVQEMIQSETQYLEANYKISQFKKKQLPFCIVVPSYNNVETGLYLRNLNSIFMQNYTNYHIVYIDDASSDKTGEYVKSYVMSRSIPLEKIEIITNKENRKPPYNIYNAITNHCKLGQLALIVQGDDALIGTNVLNLYNAIYQRDKCAMIYSSYLQVFENSKVQLGVGHQIMDEYFQKNSIRTIFQIPGKYLLSFYVDVFKSIKSQQFKDPKGYFFWFAYDRALITPLLQISYPRINIVKQILYEHRRDTDKKEYPNDWKRQSGEILAKKPYKPLKFFPFIQRNKYKYFIDQPIQKVIENSDFEAYTFTNNFQKQGITKDIHVRAIQLTQVIHNVNFKGQIVVELAQYDNSKQQKEKRIQKLLEEDKKYLNQKYRIDFYRNEELPFCIITPSYNNVKSGLYLRNLDSVFMQDYRNYHVVYIDDCSPDKTGQFVKKYLEERNIPKKHIEVIINKENKKALYNIHLGIHKYCKSGEIVAIIDGDDSFIGRNILALFNAVYQRDKAAMAYSNFLTIHNNDRTELGFCHDIDKDMFEQNTFRNSWDLPGTHLMTFYSDLFKKIKISDLTYANGTFFDYAYDRAILTPLLEMAYPRISVIKQITYEYRNDTGINDSPDDWIRVSHVILDKKPYQHLEQYPFIQQNIVYGDKFSIKTLVQTVIENTDFSIYENSIDSKVTGINKQQHINAIKLTQLTQKISFNDKINLDLDLELVQDNVEQKKRKIEKLLKEDQSYFENKYHFSKYKEKELPFCIVVSSFKSLQNGLYLRNLNSIFMQDYKNYRVVYIDDNSPSQSVQSLKKFRQENKIPLGSLKVIRNQQTLKDLSNIYYAAHNECQPTQIMFVIGQDDALIGRNVLNVLNALYQTHNSTVAYGCFLRMYNSSSQMGKCEGIDDFYFKTKTFRNHLQYEKYRLMSFYTHLFRRIKVKDLTYENGTFFNNAIDKAIMIPLIEMSYPNVLIVKEILYEDRYDKDSHDLLQQNIETNIILSKNPYEKVLDFGLKL